MSSLAACAGSYAALQGRPTVASGAPRYRCPVKQMRLPNPTVRLNGARISAYTEFAYAGAHQLTLSTALPALGIELHSSYLGHPDAGESIASHLQLGPGLIPHAWAQTHAAGALPVSAARRRCLYDHVLELQELLSAANGAEITVELADEALELVDVA